MKRSMIEIVSTHRAALAAVGVASALSSASALGAEIKVLTAGAFKPVITALAPDFEKRTGHKLVVENDTTGGLTKRIMSGEAFDVLVLTPAAIQQLAKAGKVTGDEPRPLARVAIGVAVKKGEKTPDISTVPAFQAALLSARKVAMIDPDAGGSSGIYLTQLFQKMGIADQIKAKAVLVPGGLVAERLVTGEADIAVHQISEILAVPGATLVGPIPKEIQNYTVYAGAIGAGARDKAAAESFLSNMSGEKMNAALAQKGMEAPGS
jgi:molybdate transport system substrate-binding protein